MTTLNSIATITTVLMVILKLCNVITISWWIVFSPLIAYTIIWIIYLIISIVVPIAVMWFISKK